MKCLNCGKHDVSEIFEGQYVYYLCRNCGNKLPQTFEEGGVVKLVRRPNGEYMHYSVYALARKDGKFLFVKRRRYPFTYHLLTGHINTGETAEEAIKREIFEESSAIPKNLKLVYSGHFNYICRFGVKHHKFYFFTCTIDGHIVPNDELEGFYLVKKSEIHNLEPLPETVKILMRKVNLPHG